MFKITTSGINIQKILDSLEPQHFLFDKGILYVLLDMNLDNVLQKTKSKRISNIFIEEIDEDNFTMQAEAKRLVKKDLIFEAIRRREDITLTEEEKSKFFDKYVEKYAESYGYSEDYVREELSELVYESMLYDKTVEFLIINNSFIENETDTESESVSE